MLQVHSVRRTRSSNQGSCNRWRGRARDESGQSLIIIVLAMGLILALGAYAIDVSDWDAKRHQAQLSADAAALAAANCLATNATAACSNSSATAKADAYANANGVPASNVTIGSTAVTVTTQTPAPQVFSGMFGVSPTVKARAVASYTAGVSAPMSIYGADCTNPTNPPTSGCTVDCSHAGVTITGNNADITGAIDTNGWVDINIGGHASLGPVESGPGVGTTCGANSVSQGNNTSIQDGPADATAETSFPTTYDAVWTNATTNECTASSTYTATGYSHGNITVSGGTSTIPATITFPNNNTNVGSASTPVVMCASTSITIQNNTALTDVTLVAPSIAIDGNSFTIIADPNAVPDGGGSPAVALYDTSTQALSFGANTTTVDGAVYAPLAAISVGANNSGSGVIVGNTVTMSGNNGGAGPTTTLTAFNGGDSLTQ